MSNYFKKLKQLTESLLEDYLDLDNMLVEIGVLTYLAQAGKLNDSKENQLREYILEATEQISEDVISKWLFEHGLRNRGESVGGDYENFREEYSEFYQLDSLREYLEEAIRDEEYSPSLLDTITDVLGGKHYFGSVDENKLRELVEPYIYEEDNYEDTEEGVSSTKYLNADDDDLFDILNELKGEQVQNDSAFMEMAESFTDAIKEIKEGIDIDDIKDLVVKFDKLKDLSHYNGKLLDKYNTVDFNWVNNEIEERVKGMTGK